MSEIVSLPFNKESFHKIKDYRFKKNWPVVYIINNQKEVYIGETINAHSRSKQHYDNLERTRLNTIHIISDEEYNKSATLDIESWLIQYMLADGKFLLQNGNGGLQNHNYYDKQKYKAKFEKIIWTELKKKKLVTNDLVTLKNSDIFKYSPYKSLTEDQLEVVENIVDDLKNNTSNTYLVTGKPGTGKTILAIYLFKYLKEQEDTKNLNIGLVVPMTPLRKTIKKVFKKVKGLNSGMILGPADVTKNKYDLLLVDEAHRLHRRVGITNYKSHDDTNKKLGLHKQATELDWILQSSKNQLFFYDPNQSVRPADVRNEDFKNLNAKSYRLTTQMRVEGGEEYIEFIENIFDIRAVKKTSFKQYDFKLYDDIHRMVSDIKAKDKQHQLSRIVSGYAWPWHTKPGNKHSAKHEYDIEISGLKLIWNSTAQDWVNSPNAINEVGCIHTVQGYDLNYVGVIIGPELLYDKNRNKFIVDRNKYFDINGRNGITDPEELEGYIINIYKTLLTRGIKGTYIYIVDENLRNYFKEILDK